MIRSVRCDWGFLSKAVPFVALFILIACLALSPHDLSGSWSGSALRYLLGYFCIGFFVALSIRIFLANKKNVALVACSLVFLGLAAGLVQVLSVMFVLISCGSLGVLVRRALNFDNEESHFPSSIIFGAAIYVLLFNSLISLPIHYQWVYIVIFLSPIVFLMRSPTLFCSVFNAAKSDLNKIGYELQHVGWKSFLTFMLAFTYVAVFILFPTINSDENTIHLSVWTQFDANAFFSIEPAVQMWSAAPITFALIHGILSLLSGGDAKGALNLLLLILLLGSFFKLLKLLEVSRSEKLTLATLFLSTPLIAYAVVGLQTDLFLAVLFCGACGLLIELFENYRISTAIAAIAIVSLALSAKLPAVTIAGPVLIAVVIATLRSKSYVDWGRRTWVKIICCLCVAAVLAFLPYIRAYLITGNPVFPLYNGIFKSDFLPFTNFKDMRWDSGANLTSFYGLFFNSASFVEAANNFIGGFQYFLLMPLAVVGAIWLRKKHFILLIILSFSYLLPMYFSLQYLRYFFAALPLLSIFLGVFYLIGAAGGMYRKYLSASFYVTAFFNFIFMPGVCWIFFISPLSFLMDGNRELAIKNFMPEQALNKEVNKIKPNAIVVFDAGRAFGATLVGQPIYNISHTSKYKKAGDTWATAEELRAAIKNWEVDFVYWDQKQSYSIADVQRNLVREVLINYGKPAIQVGGIVAFTITASPITYTDLFNYQQFTSLSEFRVIAGAPQLDNMSIKMTGQDVIVKLVELSGFTHFKYSVEFSCAVTTDSFVAHIDFGNGGLYYKLLNCHEGIVSYTETGLIPLATKDASIALSVRTEQSINIHKLSLGVN